MKEIIQSNTNKTIKYIKALQLKKYRDEYGKFIIEGEKLLKEALDYKASISMVLFSESFAESERYGELEAALKSSNIPLYYSDERVFKEVGETETPQGVIAIVDKMEFNLDSILKKDELCIVLLDEVRDPGNAGTIIRTADACGIDAVLLSNGSVDLYNGKTIRATMGSLFHIPVIQNLDTTEAILKLKDSSVMTIGADPHSSESCIDLPRYKRSAIIIGNESQGIGREIIELLDKNIKIPMPGRAESLNAGIAASILMYEFSIRKRYAK
ncbi:MAG TPA: RNA methyltransferase [Clostridia bacterium]|nr:RNA methyltransferase [Clostridia bacterium]